MSAGRLLSTVYVRVAHLHALGMTTYRNDVRCESGRQTLDFTVRLCHVSRSNDSFGLMVLFFLNVRSSGLSFVFRLSSAYTHSTTTYLYNKKVKREVLRCACRRPSFRVYPRRVAIARTDDGSSNHNQRHGASAEGKRPDTRQNELEAIYLVLDCIIDLGLGDRGLQGRK